MLTVALLTLWISGCNNSDCQSPPPSFQFQIEDQGITYPSLSDTLKDFGVYYQNAGYHFYVSDIKSNGRTFQSGTLIMTSASQKNPEFVVQVMGETFAIVRMETYINKSKCNGWDEISKVYVNGKEVQRNADRAYLITKP